MAKRDSFIFYRSYFEASKVLTDEQKGRLFDAIFEYGFNHKDTGLEGIEKGFFELIKPQLEANYIKWKNGCKGGRKRTETKPKKNLNKTETVANVECIMNNVNENVNVNDINSRKTEFSDTIFQFQNEYNPEMLQDFIDYWTEHGLRDRKMRFEKEKSFSITLRLKRWFKNQKEWEKEKSSGKKESLADKMKQDYGIKSN